jgi:hypothetical protein
VKYEALPVGLAKLGNSPGVAKATLEAAQRMAGNANAVGDSTYEAAPAKVTAGWNNEQRAGAVVREVQPDWEDWRDRLLLRVAEAMKVRKK